MLNSSWECRILLFIGRVNLNDQPLLKRPVAEFLMGFPGPKHHICVASFLLLEEVCALSNLSWEEESKRKHTWIPSGSASVFSFFDLAVFPYYIIVRNLSPVYKYMLSPMHPSSEFSNVGVVLETHSPVTLHGHFTSTGFNLNSRNGLTCFIKKLWKDLVSHPCSDKLNKTPNIFAICDFSISACNKLFTQ